MTDITKCPVCDGKNCEHNDGMWFYYDCPDCGFEYSGSSGIVFSGFVKSCRKARKKKK